MRAAPEPIRPPAFANSRADDRSGRRFREESASMAASAVSRAGTAIAHHASGTTAGTPATIGRSRPV